MKSREKCMMGLLIRYAPIGVRKKKTPEELFLRAGFYFFSSSYSFIVYNGS